MKLFYNNNILPFFLLIINFIVISNSIYSQIILAPAQEFQIGTGHSWPDVTCIGDLNNDGLNDVILGTGAFSDPVNDFHIFVYIQDNIGQLMAPVSYPYPPTAEISTIAIGDMNNDNLNDVVIGFGEDVGVFFQNAGGTLNPILTFFSGVTIPAYYYRLRLAIGDVNHDGLKDIVTGRDGMDILSVLYQNLSGGFDTLTYPHGGGHIEITDIDCNGLNDVVLLRGQGMATFNQNNIGLLDNYLYYSNPIQQGQKALDVGDLNNDGWVDVVEMGEYLDNNNNIHSNISLFFQDPTTHQFNGQVQIIPFFGQGEDVNVADLNCDGKNEIITADAGKVRVFSQYGNYYNAAFYDSFPNPYATHYNRQAVSIGDINNDGKKDIAIANYNHGLVIFINQSVSYGLCCDLPSKPGLPQGDTVICSTPMISGYKSNLCNCDSTAWYLSPIQAGSIIYSNLDSCTINWNNNWYGTANIYVKSFNQCGTRLSDILHVTISQLSSLDIGNDTILCANDSFQINVNGPFNSYLWQDSSSNSFYTITHGGVFSVEATNICGSRYDTIFVTEIPLPTINLPDDTLICSGTSILFDVTQFGSYTYLWQDNSTNPTYTVNNSGVYSVTITDSNNCRNEDSVTVNEMSIPIVYLPSDTVYCETINLVLNPYNPGCSYLWQDGSVDSLYYVIAAGQYSVTVSNICGNAVDTINVSEIPLPIINLPNDTSFCSGENIVLDVSQQGNFPYHYLWQDGSTQSEITISNQGNYSVIVSDSTLCSVSKSIYVNELYLPAVNLINDTSICSGTQFTLNVYYPNSSYLWNDGSILSEYIVIDDGVYAVTITNACGSSVDSSIVFTKDCYSYLDVPTAFSPNGDGNNDIIYALGKNVDNIYFAIYDRWGNKVFESKDLLSGWDGTFKGKKLDTNVFIYYIIAESTTEGKKIQKEGSISLIR